MAFIGRPMRGAWRSVMAGAAFVVVAVVMLLTGTPVPYFGVSAFPILGAGTAVLLTGVYNLARDRRKRS